MHREESELKSLKSGELPKFLECVAENEKYLLR